MHDLGLRGLEDGTVHLARRHGDARKADEVETLDGVNVTAVLTADEDLELGIDVDKIKSCIT